MGDEEDITKKALSMILKVVCGRKHWSFFDWFVWLLFVFSLLRCLSLKATRVLTHLPAALQVYSAFFGKGPS